MLNLAIVYAKNNVQKKGEKDEVMHVLYCMTIAVILHFKRGKAEDLEKVISYFLG